MRDLNGNALKATGNCFENCGQYMIDNVFTEMVLVHCIVSGAASSKIAGIEYAHAFLLNPDSDVVLDLTVDPECPVLCALDIYREAGRIREEITYTRDEALAMMHEHDHWGAWDDRLQTDADRAVAEGK